MVELADVIADASTSSSIPPNTNPSSCACVAICAWDKTVIPESVWSIRDSSVKIAEAFADSPDSTSVRSTLVLIVNCCKYSSLITDKK